MWSTELVVVFCVIAFLLGEGVAFFITALLSANKEENNVDKRKKKR